MVLPSERLQMDCNPFGSVMERITGNTQIVALTGPGEDRARRRRPGAPRQVFTGFVDVFFVLE
jgi:hypothetical protein